MSLFSRGWYTLHSGERCSWKIDCDALTTKDIETLASMAFSFLRPFDQIEFVPRGGLRLAHVLETYQQAGVNSLLIVDDVLTTGASMEQQRAGREAQGLVIFARGPCPKWVKPLFRSWEVPEWP